MWFLKWTDKPKQLAEFQATCRSNECQGWTNKMDLPWVLTVSQLKRGTLLTKAICWTVWGTKNLRQPSATAATPVASKDWLNRLNRVICFCCILLLSYFLVVCPATRLQRLRMGVWHGLALWIWMPHCRNWSWRAIVLNSIPRDASRCSLAVVSLS